MLLVGDVVGVAGVGDGVGVMVLVWLRIACSQSIDSNTSMSSSLLSSSVSPHRQIDHHLRCRSIRLHDGIVTRSSWHEDSLIGEPT